MKIGTDCIGVGVGAFIVNDNDEVFLMRRGPQSKNEAGAWDLAGGAVEFGETMEAAAVREIREELGIEIRITGQFPMIDHILKEEGQHWVTTVFKAEIVSGTPTILEPQKCSECGWFSRDALPSPIARSAQPSIAHYLAQQDSPKDV